MIGRRIEVTADLARVRVLLCDGITVVDYDRVWAADQTPPDPEHLGG